VQGFLYEGAGTQLKNEGSSQEETETRKARQMKSLEELEAELEAVSREYKSVCTEIEPFKANEEEKSLLLTPDQQQRVANYTEKRMKLVRRFHNLRV